MTEQKSGDTGPGEVAPHEGQSQPGSGRSTTVGTGSALALGCIGVVIVFLLIALALRWLTDVW